MAGADGTRRDASVAMSGEVPLIGRERSKHLLERWRETSFGGDPRVVMVSGPAGIGKTRLLAWLADEARRHGAQVHAGSGLAGAHAPFLPIRTAFADLLGTDGHLGDLIGAAHDGDSRAPPAPTQPDATSMPSLVGVADAVIAAARDTSRLIVLDDLQWFDDASLDLVAQLTTLVSHRAAAAPVPVMVVLAGRVGDPAEPHEKLAARLVREPNARRLDLGPLDHLEIVSFAEAIGGVPPAPGLATQLADAADGNPLQTQWLLRRLLSTQAVREVDGRLQASTPGPLRTMVTDIDDELSRRLEAVSPPAREAVVVAAGLGDGGSLADLALSLALTPDELDDRLDELETAGLLHEDGVRYHFTQGQLRQVSLAGLSRRKREALHLRIADRLAEVLDLDLGDHAVVMAEHLLRARAPAERIVEVAGRAGDVATAEELWTKAAQFYEAALEAADQLAETHPSRAAWSVGAGLAHFNMVDLPEAERRLCEAIAVAPADDLEIRGRAALVLIRCRLTQGTRPGQLVDLTELEAFLENAERQRREPELRTLALGLMAESYFAAFDLETGFEYSGRARKLGTEVGDDAIACMVEVADGIQHLGLLRLDEARRCFERSVAFGQRDDPGLPLGGLARHGLVCWLRGEFDAAEGLVQDSIAATEPRHQWGELSFATACSVGLAVLRGQHRRAEQLGEQARRLCRASNYAYAAAQLYPALAWSRAVTGDLTGAQEAIDEWRGAPGRGGATFRPVLDVLAGSVDHVTIPPHWREPPPADPTLLDISALVGRVELGDALDDPSLAAPALDPIETLIGRGVLFALDRGSFLPRLAGVAAFLSGDVDAALAALVRAEDQLSTRIDSPGELARCRLDRARVLIARDARGDRREAAGLLDLAAAAFDELGWLPFLERVASVRQALPSESGSGVVGPTVSTRVIMFTDIADSTLLNVRLGDVPYVELLGEHDRLVRARLRHHGGVEFKHTGDGLCAWFSEAADALDAAAGLQQDLDEWRDLHPESGAHVRCGLAAGRPVEIDGDLFGSSVAMASRVCALAGPDKTFLSAEVHSMLGDEDAENCELRGSFALRGFADDVAVYSIAAIP